VNNKSSGLTMQQVRGWRLEAKEGSNLHPPIPESFNPSIPQSLHPRFLFNPKSAIQNPKLKDP
jgi:hypothetical protein